MRRFLIASSAGVLLAAAVIAGLLRGEPGQDDEPPQVGPLVRQLGAVDFEMRESASKELLEIGQAALPALQAAAVRSEDAEIRSRANQLVRAILMFSKTTDLELVLIMPGEFQMGSTDDEPGRRADEMQHRVQITKPFLLGKYEVTQEEYARVMKTNPSWFTKKGGGAARVGAEDTQRFPVEKVTWFDAVEFCNRLSELDKFEPYYKLQSVKRDGDSIKSAEVSIAGGQGYRLPTEAEWEYACRARSKGRFFFGEENTGQEANVAPVMVAGGYGGAAPKWHHYSRTTAVGSYPSSRWGLADMHGNAAEWCWDWYGKDYYTSSPVDDPAGPASGSQRVQRGGSWLVHEEHCRSASRFYRTPDEADEYSGFRVARTPKGF